MLTMYYFMKKNKTKDESLISSQQYYNNYLCKLPNKREFKMNDNHFKCRVCLQDGTISVSEIEDSVETLKVLESVGDIKMAENDNYPKHLCKVCHDFIKTAILFRKVAKQSDNILKQPVKEESIFDQSCDQDLSDSSVYNNKHSKEWTADNKLDKMEGKKEKKKKFSPKVRCSICKKAVNRSYYKDHMTLHDPDHKKYVCDVCGKSFKLKVSYHSHILRHRTDFSFICEFCPYKAKYLELLKTHMRTHTGDYRYMCTECPARFLVKSNLNNHFMLKHKTPQLKCDSCKRAFHTKLKLQRHYEADHLGIKNHVCNICGKAFGYRSAMMKHQLHVHKREKMMSGRMPAYLVAELRNKDSQ